MEARQVAGISGGKPWTIGQDWDGDGRGDYFDSNAAAEGGAVASNKNTWVEGNDSEAAQGGTGVRTEDGTTVIERSLIGFNVSNFNAGGLK